MMGVDDLESTTHLYADMYIAAELLHCSHEEFLKLPRLEKLKLRLYAMVKALKRKEGLLELEMEMKAKDLVSSAPETIRRK
jgi:hypothetical protein